MTMEEGPLGKIAAIATGIARIMPSLEHSRHGSEDAARDKPLRSPLSLLCAPGAKRG